MPTVGSSGNPPSAKSRVDAAVATADTLRTQASTVLSNRARPEAVAAPTAVRVRPDALHARPVPAQDHPVGRLPGGAGDPQAERQLVRDVASVGGLDASSGGPVRATRGTQRDEHSRPVVDRVRGPAGAAAGRGRPAAHPFGGLGS
jgi:hypothetical protein